MKSAISVLLILATLAICLIGCKSNIPDEPATSDAVVQSYVNPYGETVAPPVNVDPSSNVSVPVQYVQTVNNVELIVSSYYVYGNSAAKISNIKLEDDGISLNANGSADVEMIEVGSKKDGMKIGFTAYDAEGKIVRSNFILANLKDAKDGDILEGRRFDFPRNTVKIVFHNYVET